ncbi:hypothetical protein ACFYSC_21130 [Streptosporangium sp. NPDC004379]|uniref:hypothetical protein n=1 Tax=Streptosporangium sp. NPDC004379 TaxID=3366189 RepID=UPI0036BAE51E
MTGRPLQLDGLSWEHGGRICALKPDRLSVAAGRVGVVLAEDADAADAFADVLLGRAWPVRGRILSGREEVTSLPSRERGIALVPAGGGLLPHLTVEQNIVFGLHGRDGKGYRYGKDFLRGQVRFITDRLDLDVPLDRRPYDLSADQRLWVAFARAMCHWRRPNAVLVEDRDGRPPCHSVVGRSLAAFPHLPVLVVGDEGDRIETLGSPSARWEVVDADEP